MLKKLAEYDCVVANNRAELLAALESTSPRILIPKHFKDTFLDTTELPLTQNEEMAFEVGGGGGAGLAGGIIYHFLNLFSKDDPAQKKIDSLIRKYALKRVDADLLLYLRLLDE